MSFNFEMTKIVDGDTVHPETVISVVEGEVVYRLPGEIWMLSNIPPEQYKKEIVEALVASLAAGKDYEILAVNAVQYLTRQRGISDSAPTAELEQVH